MKIELIKTTGIDGTWYSLEIDGEHVSNSFTRDIEKATEGHYNLIVNKGLPIIREVINSTEI